MRTRAGLLLFIDMRYTKTPIDLASQITILRQRGLIIENEEFAVAKLNMISYYRLANYWRPMENDKVNHIFKPNSKFSNIYNLYTFDKKLRVLIFEAIQSIEIALRSKMIHNFSLQYGAFWFMDESLFSSSIIFQKCIKSIDDEISRTKEEFITEHFEKYTDPYYPPAWKTLEIAPFGTISKLYSNFTDNNIKKQIARELGLPQHKFLQSWIKSLAVLRNCCAHHARVWNRNFSITPQLPIKLSSKWLHNTNIQEYKIYAQLSCIAYLLNIIDTENTFKIKLKSLILEYDNVDIKSMGFPANWESEPLWK